MAEKKAQMGDFIGFSFNGIHSSELGLVRVSDGNRYEKNLFPAISDKTAQVPGRDGFYYFGSGYNTREMTVKVAFDNLEENEFRRMTELFKDKKPHFLWFDELPYKEYLVKIKSPPNFKYLCFDEWVEEENSNGEVTKRKARIYKGEGTIIFVCYSPYARARVKSLSEQIDKAIIKINSENLNWFHNTILNGENNFENDKESIDNDLVDISFPSLEPRFLFKDQHNKTSFLSNGESIRKLFKSEFLKMWTEEEEENLGYYTTFNNLAMLYYKDQEKNENIIDYSYLEDIISNAVLNSNVGEDDIITKITQMMFILKKKDMVLKPSLLSFYNFKEWYKSSYIPLIEKEIINNTEKIIQNCGDIDMNTKILIDSINDNCKVYLKRRKEEDEQEDSEDDDTGWKIIKSIEINKEKLDEELSRRDDRGRDKTKNFYNTFFFDSKTKLFRAYDNTPIDETGPLQYSYDNFWDTEKETNEVFNNCIIKGDFFKIPPDNKEYKIKVVNAKLKDVEYTYLYY